MNRPIRIIRLVRITRAIGTGKNSIISVGSVVTTDIPDYCVVVGNPGRVIKKIDH